jgi:hypothetical protein
MVFAEYPVGIPMANGNSLFVEKSKATRRRRESYMQRRSELVIPCKHLGTNGHGEYNALPVREVPAVTVLKIGNEGLWLTSC